MRLRSHRLQHVTRHRPPTTNCQPQPAASGTGLTPRTASGRHHDIHQHQNPNQPQPAASGTGLTPRTAS
eukprot:1376740-Karenia_brevis.AAC.1